MLQRFKRFLPTFSSSTTEEAITRTVHALSGLLDTKSDGSVNYVHAFIALECFREMHVNRRDDYVRRAEVCLSGLSL